MRQRHAASSRIAEATRCTEVVDVRDGLLRAHFEAPDHAATWAQLAVAVGYSNSKAVNLHYGKFAKRIAAHLGVHQRPQGFWLDVLARWLPEPDLASGYTVFVLRRPVIEALMRLSDAVTPSVGLPYQSDRPLVDLEASVLEGEPRMHLHFRRERSGALVDQKRARARNSAGQLECEVCGFVTQLTYPELEVDICEVHHCKPLGELEEATESRLQDLAILCPNCHRAIHRTKPMMTVKKFRSRLEARARRASRERYENALAEVPDVEPEERDRL